jgi:ectoine hydroxylase-related dioxygenase (phytanoyl-CoA dioxygenase family)
MSPAEFVHRIETEGYAILPGILDPALLGPLKQALAAAIETEAQSAYPSDYGMVLLCSLYPGPMIDVLGNTNLMDPFEWVLGEGCILYAYTSSSMPPGAGNYSGRIHVDCPRLIPGYISNMGATILLDDFTADNGATWFLPASQQRPDAPTQEEFQAKAQRVIAQAGSVFYFNARLWHAGGKNQTNVWRHALTINMCRPYMKQRLDIPRAMAHLDLSQTAPKALQKMGFLAQVPASYEEYYAPPELRKFRQKAE